ncbi:MAG: LytTR family DNA-binding domain-containing protein [Bacillota bacterium]|nr:LytTR family DNA-binding domain-containing protein [Bacillota bacterium]
MKIGICDDNESEVRHTEELINNLMNEHKIEYTICEIKNAQDLFGKCNELDILFLDIELASDENGIEIGMELKKRKASCKIIITSKYQKYLIEGYKIRAERYFIKPINPIEFSIEMKSVLQDYYRTEFGFIDPKISNRKIKIQSIIYVEFDERHTYLVMENQRKLKTPYSLKYWIEMFKDYGFAQCYKSYYVNLKYVNYIDKIDVVLTNGVKIPLSRNYKKSFKKGYLESLGI